MIFRISFSNIIIFQGEYEDLADRETCKVCAAGTYQADTKVRGDDKCLTCPPGQTSGDKSSGCTDCGKVNSNTIVTPFKKVESKIYDSLDLT